MSNSPIELSINKEIAAPVEAVFQAWTQPELMKQWFAPGAMTVPNAEVDLTVGGNYLVHMHDAEENSDHIVSGTYEEIIPNEKIVFNWMWKDGVDRTQVIIELQAKGENHTLLTLTHRGFSQQEFADKHTMGWHGCLASLESHLIPMANAEKSIA